MIEWIDSAQSFVQHLSDADDTPIALDTEFIREKTYYAQLALVQVGRSDRILLVDPLALDDASPLLQLLRSPTLKLMHSPSEDLQTLRHHYGVLPRPLFDTQVAAALCGFGAGLGYQALVERVTGVRLEKGETRSDWLRRPLSPAQLSYAADDVRHLPEVFARLDQRLRELGRRDWLREDCERQLANAEDDAPDPNPHLALRPAQRMRPDAQIRLRRLLLWREAQARRSDRPKTWILDNELLIDLAQRPPAHRALLNTWLEERPRAPRRSRDELWELVAREPEAEELDIPLAALPDPRWREPLKRMQDAVAEIAAANDLPDGLLAPKRHLETLIETARWPAALDGWRRVLLEPRLQAVLDSTSQRA